MKKKISKKLNKRPRSIYVELSILITVAFLIAFACCTINNWFIEIYMDRNIYSDQYYQRKSDEYAEEIKNIVEEKALSSDELDEFIKWEKKQREINMQIVDNGTVIYDSFNGIYGKDAAGIEEWNTNNWWIKEYDIRLSDKPVSVYIYGTYGAMLVNGLYITNLVWSFLIFIIFVLLGMRKKMRYIKRLQQEVEILEGGSLEYEITVMGNDELTRLAEGLNAMRKSFLEQIQNTEHMNHINQKMITEISHDIRTPITAVTLYGEIIKNGDNLSSEDRYKYLDKILKKIQVMKDLSDRLLDYSINEEDVILVPATEKSVKAAFFDELSEFDAYIETQGFDVEIDAKWEDCSVMINEEFLSRILDNISSNILRYADKTRPVKITVDYQASEVGISFVNFVESEERVSFLSETSGGRKLGIHSVSTMMEEIGGTCNTIKDNDLFTIRVGFKRVDNMKG